MYCAQRGDMLTATGPSFYPRASPRMLRNIDACEALIFTRSAALQSGTALPRRGVERLILEAKKSSTLVAVLEPKDQPICSRSPLRALLENGGHLWQLDATDPCAADLSRLRDSLNVEAPDGFGGSDGFGQAPGMAFGREPIAARCVVLVTTLSETAAALGAGMRAVAIPPHDGGWIDEALDGVADVCLDAMGEESDASALRVDDLSTPGAYWLNPSMPRDLNGFAVDPTTGESFAGVTGGDASVSQKAQADDDEGWRALLEDVDPRIPPPAPQPLPPSPPPLSWQPPKKAAAAHMRCDPPKSLMEVSASEAAALYQSQAVTLIDVRQPAEYRLDGHIDGSRNIAAYTWEHGFYLPKEGFAAEVASEHEVDGALILLCADGMLSKGAGAALEAASFTNVQILLGGLRSWEAEAAHDSSVPSLVVEQDGEGGLTGAWV